MKRIWGTIGAAVLASALTVAGMTVVTTAKTDSTPPPLTSHEKSAAAKTDAVAAAAPVYQPSSEMVYVPITPCRIVDTRHGTGANATKFSPGTTRTYYIGGTFGFAPQGGTSGGCGIPVGATAISATVIAVGANKAGAVRAWPNGLSEPTANVLNYLKGNMTGSSNIPINASSAYALKIRNLDATTHIVVDVNGYFMKQLAGFISPSGTPYSGSSRIVNGAHTATGTYEVQFDRDIRYCAATATPYVSAYYASVSTWFDSTRPDTVRVSLWDANGASVDQYFYITVDC